MENPQGIRLNFLALDSQSISARFWRRELPEGETKPDNSLCYTLPKGSNSDERAQYIVSLDPEEGWEAWDFDESQNRQLALRYILELLVINTKLRLPPGQFALRGKFGRYLSYVIQSTPNGTQEIRGDPYFLIVTNQFGFLIDFHFRPTDPNIHNRETQRLSLSLDERYRSNKNA